MKLTIKWIIWQVTGFLFVILAGFAHAQSQSDPAPLVYRSATEEARFHALTSELRCVQCQNQSLADSNAQIAHDLRREVLKLMQDGLSDADIKQFLVQRYGEFVLYRPPLQGAGLLLWLAPLLLLLIAGVIVLRFIRRQPALSAAEPEADDTHSEQRPW